MARSAGKRKKRRKASRKRSEKLKADKELKDLKDLKDEKGKRVVFKAVFLGERVISEEDAARELYDKSRFGEMVEGRVQYSFVEALFLIERGSLNLYDGRKKLGFDAFVKRVESLEENFYTKYCVFRDMRRKGYIVKTALKFGADFRVYDRGVKPGEDHAKWILYPVSEGSSLTWHEFAAKNRVAHSTRKNLLIGIVDAESDVTYYSISWTRP